MTGSKGDVMSWLRKAILAVALLTPATGGCFPPDPPVGMRVIYQVDCEKLPRRFKPSPQAMEQLVKLLEARLAAGKAGRVWQVDGGRVEVHIFRAPLERMRRIAHFLTRPGTLELRILANLDDHKQLIQRAKSKDAAQVEDDEGLVLAWWVRVHHGSRGNFEGYIAANEVVSRVQQTNNGKTLEILVVNDHFDVTEKYVEMARVGVDKNLNPCINILLSDEGGRCAHLLTSRDVSDPGPGVDRKLGIIIDGCLRVAHPIPSPIRNRLQITGLNCRKREVRELAWELEFGPLPLTIRKREEYLIDAKDTANH